ncbi:forkhead box protein N2-like [Scleropages formosus]|uniref:Forkhead box protein N2-like n=1 Tax=Scleropages formosus TaxID=113540 RepID=A0A0P7UJC3_SCLFO|nr:forkhead box protein N2-like [Scleropages formosus]
MGPSIGMSPDKKAGTAQEERVARGGLALGPVTLPEARSAAASPCPTSLDGVGGANSDDEELTNLNWLNENLLQKFPLGGVEASAASGSLFDIEGESRSPRVLASTASSSSVSPSSLLLGGHDKGKDLLKSKPPFSFSLLIYMAIEQSPGKSLPVKDIYGWIQKHFPYFSNAPAGWKNSVRHNLSLNKCFRKVDKSLAKVRCEPSGKGSLWCVDPEHRPYLLQALKKQHFPPVNAFRTPPASPPSASSPPRHLVLREQTCPIKDSDIDAAAAMMLLNSAPELHADRYEQDGPIDLSCRNLVLDSGGDPKQDHTYSSLPSLRRVPRSGSAPLPSHSPRAHRAGSEGFHSDEDSEPDAGEDGAAVTKRVGHSCPPRATPTLGKRVWHEPRVEVDEELKEAAGSLLHLAGLSSEGETTCYSAKSAKHNRK